MSTYRIIGSKDYTCPSGEHTFRAQTSYEYSSKKMFFETTQNNGVWISPEQRPARTFIPQCPTCGECCSFDGVEVTTRGGRANVQVGEKEATAVAIHPGTGEVVYCFARPDAPMPDAYRQEGFQKVQFHHYRDLQNFCRSQGVVNDIEGDWKHDGEGYFEEDYKGRQKKEREQIERYLEEREKVKRAQR